MRRPGQRRLWDPDRHQGEGHREALRVQVLPEAVERLARVARREPLQLRVDAVARAELDLPVLDPGLEAVERPHGRAALDLAVRVVHAAVAGAHEPLRRADPAHRAAEVRAAGRDRDELVRVVRPVDLGVALAHVGGRLAGLADAPGDQRDRDRRVVVGGEVGRRPDRAARGSPASSKTGPSANPIAGSTIAAVAMPPAASAPPREERPAGHRLALEVARRLGLRERRRDRCGAPSRDRRRRSPRCRGGVRSPCDQPSTRGKLPLLLGLWLVRRHGMKSYQGVLRFKLDARVRGSAR